MDGERKDCPMNATQRLELLNSTPFQRLEIRLNNGTVIHVDEPFAIRAVRHSPTCIIFDDEGIARFVAYRNMAEVVTSDVDVNGASA
jgi:hypothetical protein